MNEITRFYVEMQDKIQETQKWFYWCGFIQLVLGLLFTIALATGFYTASLYFFAFWVVSAVLMNDLGKSIKYQENELRRGIQAINRRHEEESKFRYF